MERFVLRVLVIVLLGSTLGFWAMGHSTVIMGLPPHPDPIKAARGPQVDGGLTPPGPIGVAPVPGASGPTGTTGATITVPPVSPNTEPAKAGSNLDDYMIDLATAKQLWDTKKYKDRDVIFVDAREYVEYQEGHIAGAMSCPKRRFDGAAPKYVREYLPGNAVVVYCHGELCTDSEAVVKRLIALKLDIGPFFIIKDGLPAWIKAGYPVNKGDSEGFVN